MITSIRDSDRLARWITDASTPTLVLSLLLVAVGSRSGWAGLRWGATAALFCGVLPHLAVLWGVGSCWWTDRHVTLRHQRAVPLLFSLASVGGGVAVLSLSPGVPAPLLDVTRVVLVGAVVMFLVSLAWKISIHTSVAGSAVVVAALSFGELWLLSGVLVAVIGWARVRLRQHTFWQTVGGAVVGTALPTLLLAG